MAKFLSINKYSTEGASAILGQGIEDRAAKFHEMVAAMGASVIGYWYTGTGNCVVILETPDDDHPASGALQQLQIAASGAWDSSEVHQLFDASEIAAAAAAQSMAYQPPGS